ncbi:hypothetical protein [Hydrogenophaga sp. BPS33]|uniref:hypothetical protein n=1 Tax=Hydrogenophaga sp. BPS33 TaxID=2651974 RepID=UPI0013203B4A|nr:hypothetical protein [Hydrogenophaga sp. BPS33]QHE85148.1 hypothetical protein F9K07_09750 [Hydrogenophaga sp. BPS33]
MSRTTLPHPSGAFPVPPNLPPQVTGLPMHLSGVGPVLPGVATQLPRHVQQHQGEVQAQMPPPLQFAPPSPWSSPSTPLPYTLLFQIPAYVGAPSTPISQAAQEWVDGLLEPEPSATLVQVVHPVVPHYPVPVPVPVPVLVTPPMQWTSAALLSTTPLCTPAATTLAQSHRATQLQAQQLPMPMGRPGSVVRGTLTSADLLGLSAPTSSTSAAPLGPPAYSLEALANATPAGAVLMVGKEFARLLGEDQLEAAGQMFEPLAKKIDAWLRTDPSKERTRGVDLSNKMHPFRAPITAHLRGGCHFRSSLAWSSPWCLELRFLVNRERLDWHKGILDNWAPDFRVSERRRDALKSLIAQLSWTAQPLVNAWARFRNDVGLMVATLKKALDILVDAYAALKSSAEQQAFLDDILAAIARAYCSLQLADGLLALQGMPQWLAAPLRQKAQELIDDPGPRLFPFDKSRPAAPSQLLPAYTSAELVVQPPSDPSVVNSMALVDTTPLSVLAMSTSTPFGLLDLTSRMDLATGGMGAPTLSISVPPLSPPAYSLLALANATPTDAVLMVGGEFARLLGENQLEAAGQVLEPLVKKIDVWLLADLGEEKERGLDLCNRMDHFLSPIPAHLRGASDFYSRLTPSSSWRLALRFLEKLERLVWHKGVVDHWAPGLRNAVMRRDALKSLIAQLSWIAQPSPKTRPRQAKKELDLMDVTVKKALDICVNAYAALRSLAEQRAFRDDILAAIAPAYCSLRLADSLLALEVLPLWLDAPLRKKAQEVVDDPRPRLFPFDQRRQTAASHALSAYTPAALLGLPASEDVVSSGSLHAQTLPLGGAPSVQSVAETDLEPDSDSMAMTTAVSVTASSSYISALFTRSNVVTGSMGAPASSTSATPLVLSEQREISSVPSTAQKRQRETEVAAPQAKQARDGEIRNPSSTVFMPPSKPQATPRNHLSQTQGNMSCAPARDGSLRAPNQAPTFFEALGALQADSRRLNNSIVKQLARQAMVEADLSTRAGLRMYLGQMASLAQLPKTRQFAHTPSERLAGVFVNLTGMAEQCARGASQEWRSESEFWSDVANEMGSPQRAVLRRAMVALAQTELRGHPDAAALIERFNSARVGVGAGGGARASLSARNDTNDANAWLDSVLTEPPETPQALEQRAQNDRYAQSRGSMLGLPPTPGTSAPQKPVPESPSAWLNGFLDD